MIKHKASTDNKKYYSQHNEEILYPNDLNCAFEILKTHANSDHIAIYFRNGTWSYRELNKTINKIANFLTKSMLINPGDKVLLNGFSSPMLAACWFAIIKMGAVCVTTPSALKERELTSILLQSQATLAIVDDAFPHEIRQAQKNSTFLKEILFFNTQQKKSLESLIQDQPEQFTNYPSNKNDFALIAFTSGSTGKPKGTMHSHQDVMYICDCFPRDILKVKKDEIFAGTPPLSFTYGLGGLLLFPLRYGASTILADKLSSENLLKVISEFHVTTCFSSPTSYRLMLEHINKYNIESLKKCVSAGEHLPEKIFYEWFNKTNIKIIDGIGSTEMLHIFISSPIDQIVPGSTGKAIPGYQAKIINEQGIELKDGEVGLLAVRGPTGCCYLDKDLEKKYKINGWNLTGDLFKKNIDGYYWYHSRADDIIVSSGYNVSGVEIEEVLLEHPDVQECAVIGVPDELKGQLIKAFIKIKNTTKNEISVKALQDFVKKKLAIYKCPHLIEFIDSIPRNSTGKIQKFILKS